MLNQLYQEIMVKNELKNLLRKVYHFFRYIVVSQYCYYFRKVFHYKILTRELTVQYIIKNRCSVSRFGDGEFGIIQGYDSSFQLSNKELGAALIKVLKCQNPNILVCIPYALVSDHYMHYSARRFWREYIFKNRAFLKKIAASKVTFGDASFTRFYIDCRDKSKTKDYIAQLRGIWDGRDLLIVEGKASRLGVGNDLFENANSIKRILCPPKSAFNCYETILELTRLELRKNEKLLVLIALGMTATVLAYDLNNDGYQAIDIGHVDIEYCWYKMNARKKCPIPSKAVNECGTNNLDSLQDNNYISSIIAEI